jgi:hypothetical protein
MLVRWKSSKETPYVGKAVPSNIPMKLNFMQMVQFVVTLWGGRQMGK